MEKLTTVLFDLSLWAGAILGVLVSAAFAGSSAVIQSLIQRLPRRQLLGKLGRESEICEITMRVLVGDGEFVSFPAAGYQQQIQNTEYAYSLGDVEAAMRVISLLGQVRHSTGIRVIAVQEAAKLEDFPSVTIGGTPRAAEIVKLAPELDTSFSGDRITSGGHQFSVDLSADHALICRAYSDDINHPHFAIFGLHWIGTRAAGIFLEKHAATLGSLFGRKSFVIVLRSPMSTDTSRVIAVHYAPKISWFKKTCHPLAWHRFSKLCTPSI